MKKVRFEKHQRKCEERKKTKQIEKQSNNHRHSLLFVKKQQTMNIIHNTYTPRELNILEENEKLKAELEHLKSGEQQYNRNNKVKSEKIGN